MALQLVDWLIIAGFFVVMLTVGVLVAKRSGSSSAEYFLGGRAMPWWLLGISMVATTFSTDTPNLVTDMVRNHGVAGNWIWFPFLLTGMLTVFVYAKLWRRSGVMTDVEFYEVRYSGKTAAFLRGFRALYLGVFFNVIIMAAVSLAAIKIGGVLLKLSPFKSVAVAMLVTVIFCGLGGFRSVLITDFILFAFAMFGSVCAAIYACKHADVGGLDGLLSNTDIASKLTFLPDFTKPDVFIPVMVIPFAVQWWSVWYPGAEPGGGGYLAQRMLSAKDEKNAMGATMLFNSCHYALRPWPWILVALASMIVYPNLDSLKAAFPHVNESIIGNDLAYPAMLTFLPTGILGIVVASLVAAYVSTISTHLNWGSSYIVNDYYQRFINPNATEKRLVLVGRISTVILAVLTCILALLLSNALQAFEILLQIGAGTGLIFILRWFWWRINAWTELTGMIISFIVALGFLILKKADLLDLLAWQELTIGVAITTVSWIIVTLITRPTDDKVLRSFYKLVRPGGKGWAKVIQKARTDGEPITELATAGELPRGILCMLTGCLGVYSAIFGVGYFIYGHLIPASLCTVLAAVSIIFLTRAWKKLEMK